MVTGSLQVPEHPVHPVSSPQGTEVVVDSVHSVEVPVGGVAAPSSSLPNFVSIPRGSSSGIGGPAGGVPARDVPVPIVSGGDPPHVLFSW